MKEFTRRLYLKNPKYEENSATRRLKMEMMFPVGSGKPVGVFSQKRSHEVLSAAFDSETQYPDRVYLLGLGLVKSIREAYSLDEEGLQLSGLQIELDRLQKLHKNISNVNWRLKTYKDQNGSLLCLTNQAGENGYINMGYEVIITRVLTRIEDDIYLRGGLPEKYAFKMSTLFLSILL